MRKQGRGVVLASGGVAHLLRLGLGLGLTLALALALALTLRRVGAREEH